jgi:hypothetical protein
MPSRTRQARAAAHLLLATTSASASVITARSLAFCDPAPSRWHHAEAQRMSTEKMAAAGLGWLAVCAALALLPYRSLAIASQPRAWTPAGWFAAWLAQTELLIGVGNAALRPAKSAAVRNRYRLARRHQV